MVPGAVILSEVVDAAIKVLGAARVTGLDFVKFSSPMLPEERCELAFICDGEGQASFEVTRAGARVASGRLKYEPAVTR